MQEFDSKQISKDYTYSILQQCSAIEAQLTENGMDGGFTRLISIEATYNSFKQLVSQLTDQDSVREIIKIIELDAKNMVSIVKPNVDYTGTS